MTRSVSDVFIETLVAAGVTRVYGVVGDSLNGLTDVIRRNKNIEWLHVRRPISSPASGPEFAAIGQSQVAAHPSDTLVKRHRDNTVTRDRQRP
jgi:pyruvate dehydrogenase (quinone)